MCKFIQLKKSENRNIMERSGNYLNKQFVLLIETLYTYKAELATVVNTVYYNRHKLILPSSLIGSLIRPMKEFDKYKIPEIDSTNNSLCFISVNNMADNLKFVLESKRVLFEINNYRKVFYQNFKPAQLKCIRSALECDTLGILPTGYGKSLIFEALPYFKKSTILVITPLNSIIEEQVSRYGKTAIKLNESLILPVKVEEQTTLEQSSSEETRRLQLCEFNYVIGHPEQFVTKRAFTLFMSAIWQKRVSHIVIDEAHCVTEWGVGFRDKFLELSKLKSVFPKAYVLALTATATISLQNKISEALRLKNPNIITCNIDRKNIKLCVKRRPAVSGGDKTAEESYDFVFSKFRHDLQTQQEQFEKTIIYTKLKWCGYGFEEITRPLFSEETSSYFQQFVAQYHSPCTPQMRSKVLADFSKVDSRIRLLLATEAFSMGTDVPDIRRVIHAGVPTTMETYIQEVGRAGRDGEESTAILYYNRNDISAAVSGMTEEMRQYCDLKTCRRKYVCQHFGFELEEKCKYDHLCCDNCERNCKCNFCLLNREDMLEGIDTIGKCLKHQTPKETKKQKHIHELLCLYFDAENSIISAPNASLYTGLTSKLAQQIAKDCLKYKSVAELEADFPCLSGQTVSNIYSIIHASIQFDA